MPPEKLNSQRHPKFFNSWSSRFAAATATAFCLLALTMSGPVLSAEKQAGGQRTDAQRTESQKPGANPYIKNYVNYGADEPADTIPAERAMNASAGRLGVNSPRQAPQPRPPLPPRSQGKAGAQWSGTTLLQGHLDLYSTAFHGAGIMLDSIRTPALVLSVRGGSPAYYAGVCPNDRVDSFKLQGDTLMLNIRRNGVVYSANVRTSAAPIATATPTDPTAPADTIKDPTKLSGAAEKQEVWKQLSKYQLALLIDRSGSMQESVAEGDESRWLWVAKVVQTFADDASAIANKTIALGTFASDYHIDYNVQPTAISGIFRNLRPDGGTMVSGALQEIIQSYFRGSRDGKLLVVIATDGTPDDFKKLKSLIIDTSRRITSPGQIEILFVGIGEDMNGRAIFNYLDHSLQEEGAAADIVEQVPFSDVRTGGLDRALARTLGGRN